MTNIHPDISIKRNRKKLRPRKYPYFQQTVYCRAIGLEKVSNTVSYWVARYRKSGGYYKQRRLGMADAETDADGSTTISFEQASDFAKKWFESPENQERAATPFKLGPTSTVNYEENRDVYTVGNALLEWMAWKRLQSTQSSYLSLVSRSNYYLIPMLGDAPAESMNSEALRKFVTRVLELPAKPGRSLPSPPRPIESYDNETLRKRKKVLNGLISMLRGSLEMAWENGRVSSVLPSRCMKRLKNPNRPRVLHLSRAECRALLDQCAPDLRRLVLGGLYTGCRITELMEIRCSHVGRDGYGVYIEPRKSLKPRFVFLPDEGMAFFLSMIKNKAPDEFVFTRDDKLSWRYRLRYAFQLAVQKAKLPQGFCFHGLRHTYASQLIQSGAPMIVVADQLGHANTNTVSQTYGHLSPQIRESEVRQRFTSIDGLYARKAVREKKKMASWRESLHGGDWRTYATIHDLTSISNTRH